MAVVESLAQSILYAALFLVSFVGLTILLKLLIRAMDLVLRRQGPHLVNALGGAVIGLIEGPWCCFWPSGFCGASASPLRQTPSQPPIFYDFLRHTRP